MLTAEQRQARLGKVTSSIAAAALGLHQHMTPLQAWLAVKGELPDKDTKATERGNRLERVILESVAEDLGLTMRPAEFRSLAPWAGDSADALYLDDLGRPAAIGEGKSAAMGVARQYGEEETDEIPEATLIQSHWHLLHWPEVRVCWVPVLVGGYAFEFRRYRVDRDEELEGVIWQDLERWHQDYVLADKPPPLRGGDEDWILRQHPKATRPMMLSTPEIEDLARSYDAAHEALKVIEANKKTAGARLRQLLGEHEGVRADWGSISYGNTKGKVSWKAVALELGASEELITKHTPEGGRTLRVTVRSK